MGFVLVTKPCPQDSQDFRAQQCAAYNNATYGGSVYTWLPYTDKKSPCTLYCIPKGTRTVVRLAPKVLDGTRCKFNALDMCISGKCWPVGCDHKLDSSQTQDLCGVCGGNNSCLFNSTRERYHWVEIGMTPCSASCGVGVQHLQYRCRDRLSGNQVPENRCFKSPKPSEREKSCFRRECPPVWKIFPWQACTVNCGGGLSTRAVRCMETSPAGRQHWLHDSFCPLPKPSTVRPCNPQLCPRWYAGEWSPSLRPEMMSCPFFCCRLFSTVIAVVVCCSAWSLGSFKQSPWQQTKLVQVLDQQKRARSDVPRLSDDVFNLLNSSFCQTNVYLTEDESQFQNILCKSLNKRRRTTVNKSNTMASTDSVESEMFLNHRLPLSHVDSVGPVLNKKSTANEPTSSISTDDNRPNMLNDVIKTELTEDVKSKRQSGSRSISCRSLSQTYGENEPLPWTCRQRKEWQSLPDNVYPNRVYVTVCESSTCMSGHFNCTPVTYNLELLKMCLGSQCNDDRVPYSLRSSWKFYEYPVTIGCSCTR
ncbi:ADAMTS-like protein 1 [Bulinus truncatus]|nr:ADAMTS-like protein 1 [Bulinus truncatus]